MVSEGTGSRTVTALRKPRPRGGPRGARPLAGRQGGRAAAKPPEGTPVRASRAPSKGDRPEDEAVSRRPPVPWSQPGV